MATSLIVLTVCSMLQRMFLCWRWWRREDLGSLLKHARVGRLTNDPIPVLAGFERVAAAARGDYSSKEAVPDDMLEEEVFRVVQAAGVVHISHPLHTLCR